MRLNEKEVEVFESMLVLAEIGEVVEDYNLQEKREEFMSERRFSFEEMSEKLDVVGESIESKMDDEKTFQLFMKLYLKHGKKIIEFYDEMKED